MPRSAVLLPSLLPKHQSCRRLAATAGGGACQLQGCLRRCRKQCAPCRHAQGAACSRGCKPNRRPTHLFVTAAWSAPARRPCGTPARASGRQQRARERLSGGCCCAAGSCRRRQRTSPHLLHVAGPLLQVLMQLADRECVPAVGWRRRQWRSRARRARVLRLSCPAVALRTRPLSKRGSRTCRAETGRTAGPASGQRAHSPPAAPGSPPRPPSSRTAAAGAVCRAAWHSTRGRWLLLAASRLLLLMLMLPTVLVQEECHTDAEVRSSTLETTAPAAGPPVSDGAIATVADWPLQALIALESQAQLHACLWVVDGVHGVLHRRRLVRAPNARTGARCCKWNTSIRAGAGRRGGRRCS